MFTFQKGEGVFKNGVRIEPSENFSLERSVVSFNAGRQKENRDWMLMTLTKILHKVKSIKFLGSSALDLCYVGAGIMDATIYPQLSTFDVAFAIGFVRESGGVVVNEKFENLELSFEKQKVLAFKNQKAMESFRELLLMPH
jgi:myo-inositol-1(or 4)-monophosphatase